MGYKTHDIVSKLDYFSIFYDDIANYWREQGSDLSELDSIMDEKKQKMLDGKVRGFMLFESDEPVGICWVEQVSPFYGDIFCHSIKPATEEVLVDEVIRLNVMNGALLSLSEMELGGVFHKLFCSKPFLSQPRQRMALDYDEERDYVTANPDLVFKPYTSEYINAVAKLSFDAHEVSKDQVISPDFNSLERRIELEKEAMSGKMGKLIEDGSLLVFKDDQLAGMCVVMETQFWGIEQLPWIFDISVHPDFMGSGIGKQLLHRSIQGVFEWSYDTIGLAVTLSNTSAISLYETSGFKAVEAFTEFFHNV